jgi:cytochrome c-type biogenesis protein CcmH/NrfG
VSREAEAYDARRAACHARFNAPAPGVSTEPAAHAPPCKVATKDCINCHLPKYEIRVSHYSFTDHRIRVVKPGDHSCLSDYRHGHASPLYSRKLVAHRMGVRQCRVHEATVDYAVKSREIRRTLGLDVCRVSLLWMGLMCRPSITGQDLQREYLNTAPEVAYVGDTVCQACHPAEFASFKRTGMGRSMRPPSVADELGPSASPAKLQSAVPGVSYRVYVSEGKVFQGEEAVDAKGRELFSEAHELAHSVGSGSHGRSYLIWRGDFLFVAPLSYYTSESRWDLSPGHDTGLYRGFTRPAGELCIYCHSSLQLVPGTYNQFRQSRPGAAAIECERCHGPGQTHVARRSSGAPPADTVDRSIVNPAKLDDWLRDDLCNQCHLAGDARVPRLGTRYADFRPGTPLDNVVALFSVSPAMKASGLQALGHVDQLHLSRCWTATAGRLGCITCHDPHAEPQGNGVAAFYRQRCLTCHISESCTVAAARRKQTQPPDNCVGCHMPLLPLTNISHTAFTDHRIPRSAGATRRPLAAAGPSANPKLIRETRPAQTGLEQSPEDLRALALAYVQVAGNYPAFAGEGLTLLERAARLFPRDAEVQAAYGLVLLVARPGERALAEAALRRAVDLGSNSADARLRLAGLLVEDGKPEVALHICQDTVQLNPYSPAALLRLARTYSILGDHRRAVSTLERLLGFDPGNEAARRALDVERNASAHP